MNMPAVPEVASLSPVMHLLHKETISGVLLIRCANDVSGSCQFVSVVVHTMVPKSILAPFLLDKSVN